MLQPNRATESTRLGESSEAAAEGEMNESEQAAKLAALVVVSCIVFGILTIGAWLIFQ